MATTKDTCDGDAYIHNLAAFIRSHERQLANALLAYKRSARQRRQRAPNDRGSAGATAHAGAAAASSAHPRPLQRQQNQHRPNMRITKPVRLSMSLHHLYFLLGRFQDLGIDVGPMSVRLDNIDSETPGNYVSFLSEFQRKKLLPSDAQSIHSMSSVKSVMSSVSALWNSLSVSSRHYDNISADLQYLYSAFSKIPCLRLANDPKAKLIKGHEEYPFETATPVDVFHSLVVLEICEIDPKEVFGWDVLSGCVRYLVIKRAGLTDPADVLVQLVEDDAEKRAAGGAAAGSADSAVFDEPAEIMSLSTLKRHRKSVSSPRTYPGAKFAGSSGSSLSSSIPTASHARPRAHRPTASVGTGETGKTVGESASCSAASDSRPFTGDPRPPAADIHPPQPQRRPFFFYQQAHSQHRRSARSNSAFSDTARAPVDPEVADERHAKVVSSVSLPLSADGSMDLGETAKRPTHQDSGCWRLLRHLSFTGNRIAKLAGWYFDNLAGLSSLDLSYNRLTRIPTDALSRLVNLKSLNLSFNQLSSTDGMPHGLNKLAVVNLRGNAIADLQSVDRLVALEKIDLRQNCLAHISDFRPLLLIDTHCVRLKAVYLSANPVSATRGYRIALFDLFNGVDYSNTVRIDGSRPGIFESRMLLDRKAAKLNFAKFLDATIIRKMAASVSEIAHNGVVITAKAGVQIDEQTDAESAADAGASHGEDVRSPASAPAAAPAQAPAAVPPSPPPAAPAGREEKRHTNPPIHQSHHHHHHHPCTVQVLAPNPNAINTSSIGTVTPPQKPFNPRPAAHRSSTLTSLLDKISISSTNEQSETSRKSISPKISSRRASQGSNPIARISVAAPALPIMTNATTLTARSSTQSAAGVGT